MGEGEARDWEAGERTSPSKRNIMSSTMTGKERKRWILKSSQSREK